MPSSRWWTRKAIHRATVDRDRPVRVWMRAHVGRVVMDAHDACRASTHAMASTLRWASARSRAVAGCAWTARIHPACDDARRDPSGTACSTVRRRSLMPGTADTPTELGVTSRPGSKALMMAPRHTSRHGGRPLGRHPREGPGGGTTAVRRAGMACQGLRASACRQSAGTLRLPYGVVGFRHPPRMAVLLLRGYVSTIEQRKRLLPTRLAARWGVQGWQVVTHRLGKPGHEHVVDRPAKPPGL